MASTFSPILRIELIGTADQSGTWGNTTNVNLGTLIEDAIAGTATISVTAGNVTLSNFNGAADQARCMAIRTTGTPGVSRNLIAPAVSKFYIIANGSDAAVVIKTSVSTGVSVPTGEVYLVYYDTTSADFRLVGRAAASANNANTLVLRDGSGNFAAGQITGSAFVGGTGTFTNLSSTGNTFIGDSAGDTLTVAATPAFLVAIPVTSGGTGVTTSTGSGSNVLNTSPTLVTPILGTPASGTLTNCTSLPIDGGTTGTLPVARGGTGVTTSTGSGNVVLSTSPTLVTPLLGTPTSGTLTNCTGLPLTTGVTGTLPVANGGTGVTTSTGSGNNVLSTSPTLVTPILGTPTSGTLTNCTGLPLTTGVTGTLPVANGGTGVTTSTGSGSSVLSTGPSISGATITTSTVNGNTVGSNSVGARTVSTSAPTGGADGDIWYQY
jgi:hypothetical protein